MPIIEIPEKDMVVEFPDSMSAKDIERVIYSDVFDPPVLANEPGGYIPPREESAPVIQEHFAAQEPEASTPQTVADVEQEGGVNYAGYAGYVPFLALKAVQGLYQHIPGLDKPEQQIAAYAEFWKQQIPEVNIPDVRITKGDDGWWDFDAEVIETPLTEILGATAQMSGMMLPASKTLQAGELVASAARISNPFFKAVTKGMIGGALLGEGKKDETLELAAMFGLFEGAGYAIGKIPRIVKAVKESTPYRKATIQERGLVLQSMEEVLKKNPDLTPAKASRLFKDVKAQEIAKRATGEVYQKKTVEAKPEATIPAAKAEAPVIPDPAIHDAVISEVNRQFPEMELISGGNVPDAKGNYQFMFLDGPLDGLPFEVPAAQMTPDNVSRMIRNIDPEAARAEIEYNDSVIPELVETAPEPIPQYPGQQQTSRTEQKLINDEVGRQFQKTAEAEEAVIKVEQKAEAGADYDPTVIDENYIRSEYADIINLNKGSVSTDFELTEAWINKELAESTNLEATKQGILSEIADDIGNLIETAKYQSQAEAFKLDKNLKKFKAIVKDYTPPKPAAKVAPKEMKAAGVESESGTYTISKPSGAKGVITEQKNKMLTAVDDALSKHQTLDVESIASNVAPGKWEVVDKTNPNNLVRIEKEATHKKGPPTYLINGEKFSSLKKAKDWAMGMLRNEVTPQGEVIFTDGKYEFKIPNAPHYLKKFRQKVKSARGVRFDIKPEPGKGVTPAEIKKQFKGQRVTTNKDGSTSIRLQNGKGIHIKQVERISDADVSLAVETGRMGRYGKVLGKAEGNKITLTPESSPETLTHENYHVLENLGIIDAADQKVLDQEFKKLGLKDEGVNENRANTMAELIKNRKNYRSSMFKRLIQKVKDFFDSIINAGRQSARKLAREFEKGKVFERKATGKTSKGKKFSVSEERPEPKGFEAPEILKLAKELMNGRLPEVAEKLGRNPGTRGLFAPRGDGRIYLRADLAKNPAAAAKTLSHEIGHLVDYLDEKTMLRGNILGRVASLKKFAKHTLPSKPGGAPQLTPADKARIRHQAKKLKAEGAEVWIDEIITKETKVTPDDILGIWNNVEGSINKDLLDYVKSIGTAEKKAIVKDAMKGVVPEEIKRFAKKEETKTGKQIKVAGENQRTVNEIYKDLISDEIKKRQLVKRDTITQELKDFSQMWRPFDETVDPKYTKYRHSSKELYADAVSGLVVDPVALQKQAPVFFDTFLNYLGNKPSVKQIYSEILDIVGKSDAEKAAIHLDDVYGMFKRSARKRAAAIELDKETPVGIVDWMSKTLMDRNAPILKEINKASPGANNPLAENARMAVQELAHTPSVTGVYLADFNEKVLAALDKAGYTLDDLGVAGFYKRIAAGDRADKWNPLAIDQKVAERDLSIIGKEIWGAEKFGKIQDALKEYRDLREGELYPLLEESALFKPELMKHLKANKNHLKWDVAAYFDKVMGGKSGSAKIHKQIGTVAEIDNPITATVLQDISLMRTALINKGKQEVVDFLKSIKGATKAKLRYSVDAKGWVPKVVPKDKGILALFEKSEPGKPQYYEVDKTIADVFEYTPMEANKAFELWQKISWVQKQLVVGKNLGWMAVNLPRDVMGAIKNTPGLRIRDIPKFTKKMGEVWPEVKNEAYRRKMSPRIRGMKKRRGLPQFRQWDVKDLGVDDEIRRQLVEFRVIPEAASEARNVPQKLKKAYDWMENTAQASEIWAKVGTEKFLEEAQPGTTPRQRARITREFAGTPDAKQKGKAHRLMNSIYMFSNMRIAGLRQGVNAFKADPGGYTRKTAFINAASKSAEYLLMANGGALLAKLIAEQFPEDEQEAAKRNIRQLSVVYDRISTYYKQHYNVVPLGLTDTGKAVFLTLPQDYEGQIFGGLSYITTKGAMDAVQGKFSAGETFQDVVQLISEQKPYNWHPVISTLYDAATYAKGMSPETWTGYDVIPRNVQALQGWDYIKESWPYMWRHFLSNVGVAQLVPLGRPGISAKQEWYEELFRKTGINPLGRYLRFSDKGLQEEVYAAWDKDKAGKARVNLDLTKGVIAIIDGKDVTPEQGLAMWNNGGTTKKKLIDAITKQSDSAAVRILGKAQNDRQRILAFEILAEQENRLKGDQQ